jgi:hypothetical protein
MKPSLSSLFITGWLQVFFVAISTYMISKAMYLGAFLSAFLISYLWTINVKRINTSTKLERLIYSLGAAIGSISGLFFSKLILTAL